jgi:hypothetical protein
MGVGFDEAVASADGVISGARVGVAAVQAETATAAQAAAMAARAARFVTIHEFPGISPPLTSAFVPLPPQCGAWEWRGQSAIRHGAGSADDLRLG